MRGTRGAEWFKERDFFVGGRRRKKGGGSVCQGDYQKESHLTGKSQKGLGLAYLEEKRLLREGMGWRF